MITSSKELSNISMGIFNHSKKTNLPLNDGFQSIAKVRENIENYELKLDLPCAVQGNFFIEIGDRKLSVYCPSISGSSKDDGAICDIERKKRGRLQHTFFLPEHVNCDEIKAIFSDGVLEITLPKSLELMRTMATIH